MPPKNSGKNWSQEDDIKLATHIDNGLSNKEIAAKLGRTEGAIAVRRSNTKVSGKNRWNLALDEVLIDLSHDGFHVSDIAEIIDSKNVREIRDRRIELNLQSCPVKPWTKEHTSKLQGLLLRNLSIVEIAEKMSMTRRGVRVRKNQVLQGKFTSVSSQERNGEFWTPEDDAELMRLWTPHCTTVSIADALERTESAILSRKTFLENNGKWKESDAEEEVLTDAEEEVLNDAAEPPVTVNEIPMEAEDVVVATNSTEPELSAAPRQRRYWDSTEITRLLESAVEHRGDLHPIAKELGRSFGGVISKYRELRADRGNPTNLPVPLSNPKVEKVPGVAVEVTSDTHDHYKKLLAVDCMTPLRKFGSKTGPWSAQDLLMLEALHVLGFTVHDMVYVICRPYASIQHKRQRVIRAGTMSTAIPQKDIAAYLDIVPEYKDLPIKDGKKFRSGAWNRVEDAHLIRRVRLGDTLAAAAKSLSRNLSATRQRWVMLGQLGAVATTYQERLYESNIVRAGWDSDQDKSLIELHKDNVLLATTAEVLGHTLTSVLQRKIDLGLLKSRDPWTDENQLQLVAMMEQQLSYREIASTLGIDYLIVAKRANSIGLKGVGRLAPRLAGMLTMRWAVGDTIEELAERHGLSQRVVESYVKYTPPPKVLDSTWRKDEHELFIKAVEEGKTGTELAELLSRPIESIYYYSSKHKIPIQGSKQTDDDTVDPAEEAPTDKAVTDVEEKSDTVVRVFDDSEKPDPVTRVPYKSAVWFGVAMAGLGAAACGLVVYYWPTIEYFSKLVR